MQSARTFSAFERRPGAMSRDLRELRVAALAFSVAVGGPHPIAAVYALDEEGEQHWLAARSASCGVEAAYVDLLSHLLQRGLQTDRTLIVDAGGYPRFARRLEHALGSVLHVGGVRERGGAGVAW
jgi:hypothetical protein